MLKPAAVDFKKLFIHNLDFKLTTDDLSKIFGIFGRIASVQVPKDREGRHRGLGFVEFEEHEDAKRALQEMDGKRVNTREIRFDIFREKVHPPSH